MRASLVLRDELGRERIVREALRPDHLDLVGGASLLDDIQFDLEKLGRPMTAATTKPWEDEG